MYKSERTDDWWTAWLRVFAIGLFVKTLHGFALVPNGTVWDVCQLVTLVALSITTPGLAFCFLHDRIHRRSRIRR